MSYRRPRDGNEGVMETKVRAIMKWVGPAAIVGAMFTVLSDQVGLVVHLPEMGNDSMGYHAVGSGLFLLIFTLLLVGMFGLYARRPEPGAARVLEYGDAHARYVLVVDEQEETSAGTPAPMRRATDGVGAPDRRHAPVRGRRALERQRTHR